jgi:uncharacterized protein (DUF2384 family)
MLDLDTLINIGFSSEQSEALLQKMERIKDIYGLHSDPRTSESREDQMLVLAYALNVFGDSAKCAGWLCKKWHKIGGEVPLVLLKSSKDIKELYDALTQIDSGFSA